MMKYYGSFGSWLKQRRRALDLTQVELADQVGCAVVTLRRIESDLARPSKQMAARLADVLTVASEDQGDFVTFARRTPAISAAPPYENSGETQPETPNTLPRFVTPFIGRAVELREIETLLVERNCRLLTLTGPGGIGKTRLAVQVASEQMPNFPDGVHFIDLSPLGVGLEIVAAVAQVIEVRLIQGTDPKQQLLNALHAQKMLLLLDNFEHLLDSALVLNEILAAAPNVKLVVTSRERLNLSSETVFVVGGLAFTTQEPLSEAAQLFIQTAMRVKPDFKLQTTDERFLARICALVEGMPLALVLATGWLSMLTMQEIAYELASSLEILETELKDIPQRQRRIRDVFDNTYQRLNDDEQRLFRSIAVFRGGCTRGAILSVSGASLNTLHSLIDKFLVRRDAAGRYQIHELLRQYAEKMLIEDRDALLAQERHALYFAQFLQEHWEDLKGQRQVAALAEIDADFENIRAAWRWLAKNQHQLELGKPASSLWFYLTAYERTYEGVDLFEHAVDALRPVWTCTQEKWVLGHLLGCLANFQGHWGLYDRFKSSLDEALSILDEQSHPEELFILLLAIREAGVNRFGRYEEAGQVAEEAVRIARSTDNAWMIRYALASQCNIRYILGRENGEAALGLYQELMRICAAAGDVWQLKSCCIHAAWLAIEVSKFPEAETFSRAAIQVSDTLGSSGNPVPYIRLGESLSRQGRETEARHHFHRGIKLAYNQGANRLTLILILTTIEYYLLEVDNPFSVELLAMISHDSACDSVLAGWTVKSIVALKAELPADVYQTLWQRGSRWSLDHAVALVLEYLEN